MTKQTVSIGMLLAYALIATALIADRFFDEPAKQDLMSVELPSVEFDYDMLPVQMNQPGLDGRFTARQVSAALRSREAYEGYAEVVTSATPLTQRDAEELWAVMQRRPQEIVRAAGFTFPVSPDEWMRACTHFGKLLRSKGLNEGAESGLEAARLGLRAYWKSGKLETDDPWFIPLKKPSRNKDGYRSYNPSTL